MKKQTKLEEELEKAVYGSRMLVLLETSEGFIQVRFTEEQFKKMSDALASCFEMVKIEGDKHIFDMKFEDKFIPLEPFEGLEDFYD